MGNRAMNTTKRNKKQTRTPLTKGMFTNTVDAVSDEEIVRKRIAMIFKRYGVVTNEST